MRFPLYISGFEIVFCLNYTTFEWNCILPFSIICTQTLIKYNICLKKHNFKVFSNCVLLYITYTNLYLNEFTKITNYIFSNISLLILNRTTTSQTLRVNVFIYLNLSKVFANWREFFAFPPPNFSAGANVESIYISHCFVCLGPENECKVFIAIVCYFYKSIMNLIIVRNRGSCAARFAL